MSTSIGAPASPGSRFLPYLNGTIKWAAILLAVLAAVYIYLDWREGRSSADLEKFRQQVEVREGAVALQEAELAVENDRLKGSIDELKFQVSSLERTRQNLAAQVGQLQAAAEIATGAVEALETTEVAQSTAQRLEVPAGSVQAVPEGILMDDPASRKNLQELILGQSARKQVELAVQEVAALESQKSNLERQAGQWRRIAENNQQRVEAVTDLLTLKSEQMRKEIKTLRAQSRKRYFMWALGGAAAGAILASR